MTRMLNNVNASARVSPIALSKDSMLVLRLARECSCPMP